MHCGSFEYEDGGDEQGLEKNGGTFRGRQRPRRAVAAWMEAEVESDMD